MSGTQGQLIRPQGRLIVKEGIKLNYKRTFTVGLAFMSICAFWQLYDNIIPLILKNTFHLSDTLSGVIMALDNVIALFLLPLLGAVSDKRNTRIGRRMPFIITGTALAAVLMTVIPILDNTYFETQASWVFPVFLTVLGGLLISMALYRSPAVALMPDVTPKPLRSKGNAVINLMGSVGGIAYLIISSVMFRDKGVRNDYLMIFLIIAAIMVISVLFLYLKVNEPECVKEVKEYEAAHPEDNLEVVNEATEETYLPKEVKKSLYFILASIALWFFGYNAVTTAFSRYATIEWDMSLGQANLCLTVAMAVAIISYIPIGELASRIGRKKSIISGVILLSACFLACFVLNSIMDGFSPVIVMIFCFIGIAWATINVNSLPMVVEMCKESDIGRYTGYYYTCSMAAQIVTPILSGALLEHVGYWTMFPYGALFVFFSLLTMLNVRHGDNKPKLPEDKLELLDAD